MMKTTRWFIGENSYYRQVTIYLEEAPFYIFWLERVANYICDCMNYFDFKIPFTDKIKIKDEDGVSWTIYDYYGGSASMYHSFIHHPIIDYCFPRISYYTINMDWDEAKRRFPKYFDWETLERESKEYRLEEMIEDEVNIDW